MLATPPRVRRKRRAVCPRIVAWSRSRKEALIPFPTPSAAMSSRVALRPP